MDAFQRYPGSQAFQQARQDLLDAADAHFARQAAEDDKALADFGRAIELAPDSAKAYNNFGFFLENRGLFAVGRPGEIDLFFSRKIGISDSDYWEITDGLKEGQEIVSGGYKAVNRELEDGKKIHKGTPEKTDEKEKK